MIHGNGNAMLAFAFPPEERGRAYAFPITGSRIGTFIGVGFFGILLQFANWDAFAGWRLVFLTMLPIGLLVIKSCLPVVRRNDEAIVDKENPLTTGRDTAGGGVGGVYPVGQSPARRGRVVHLD